MNLLSLIFPCLAPSEPCFLEIHDLVSGERFTSLTAEKVDSLEKSIQDVNRALPYIQLSYREELPVRIRPQKDFPDEPLGKRVFLCLYHKALAEGKLPPYVLFSGAHEGWALSCLSPAEQKQVSLLKQMILEIEEDSVEIFLQKIADFLKENQIPFLVFRSLCLYCEKEITNLSPEEASFRILSYLGASNAYLETISPLMLAAPNLPILAKSGL